MKPKMMAAAGMVLAAVTACSTEQPAAGPTSAEAVAPAPGIQASLVKEYDSFDEAAADSDIAIRGTAGTSTEKVVNGMTFTVTTVHVSEWLDGSGPDTVRVMQVGTAESVGLDGRNEATGGDFPAILAPGQEYLLYLYEWYLNTPSEHTGLFMITGGVGAYSADEDGSKWQYAGRPAPHDFTESPVVSQREFTEPLQ